MSRRAPIWASPIVLAILAGCAGPTETLDDAFLFANDVPAVRAMVPQGPAFNDELRRGYLRLADAMKAANDDGEYRHFARKAVAAARGLRALPRPQVQPDALTLRELPPDEAQPLAAARERLIAALEHDPLNPPPAEAAAAQVAFDCWLEAAASGKRPALLDSCRNRVTASLERLPPATAR